MIEAVDDVMVHTSGAGTQEAYSRAVQGVCFLRQC